MAELHSKLGRGLKLPPVSNGAERVSRVRLRGDWIHKPAFWQREGISESGSELGQLVW